MWLPATVNPCHYLKITPPLRGSPIRKADWVGGFSRKLVPGPERGVGIHYFLSALLLLPLLTGFTAEAIAQTLTPIADRIAPPATLTVAENAGQHNIVLSGQADTIPTFLRTGFGQTESTATGRSGGTACQAGDDFYNVNNNITISSTATTSHTTTNFRVCEDTVDEPDETIEWSWDANLSQPFNDAGANCSRTDHCETIITITDNDPTTVTLEVTDATASEGGGIGSAAEITLTLGRALRADENLSVPLQFSGGVLSTDFSLYLPTISTVGLNVNTGVV